MENSGNTGSNLISIEDLDFTSSISTEEKKEIEKKIIPDTIETIEVDENKIKKLLNIIDDDKKRYTFKQVKFEVDLLDNITMLAKYEDSSAMKLITKALESYVKNRKPILDKIKEIREKNDSSNKEKE